MKLRPRVHQKFRNLAWLDIDSQEGQEYWKAMNLMGRYAAANHQTIHKHVLKALWAEPLLSLENHHNFAWEEMVDGEKVIVHRKGATPASPGTYGIVPGSMGDPGYIVRGKGELSSLSSCSHGAGRKMSRTGAFKCISREAMEEYLSERGVSLISGDLDEAPMAYKDIRKVMAAQNSLVDIMGEFFPRLVKMAPPENFGRKKRWGKKKQD
jgi:tRNA-splicing ligase RtcB